MKKTFLYLLAIIATVSLFFTSIQAQDFVIKKSVLGSGGAVKAKNSAGESLSFITGQFVIEKISRADVMFDVYQGFWVPEPISTNIEEPNISISVNQINNYPNPFSHSTEIRCELQRAGYVTLNIYDVMGNHIITLFEGMHNAGMLSINWNARDKRGIDVSSGSYLYELTVRPGQLAGAPTFDTYSLRNLMVIVK